MKTKILLLHGALGSKKQFGAVKLLLENKFDVYDLNFEGHGESISDKAFSIKLFSENVIEFLDKESIQKINIFGYSMGGYVALQTALVIPEKIDGIITLGTKFNWDLETTKKEVRFLNPEKIAEKVPHFAVKLKAEHHPQNWKEVVDKTAQMMVALSEGEKLKDQDLKQIRNRVVVGLGNLDSMVSLQESEQASRLLPNAVLKVLQNVEHVLEKINPSELSMFIEESIK